MASKKISDMNAAAALAGDELVEVVQAGDNVRTTVAEVADQSGVRCMSRVSTNSTVDIEDGGGGIAIFATMDFENDYEVTDVMRLEAFLAVTFSGSTGVGAFTLNYVLPDPAPTMTMNFSGLNNGLTKVYLKYEFCQQQSPFGSIASLRFIGSDTPGVSADDVVDLNLNFAAALPNDIQIEFTLTDVDGVSGVVECFGGVLTRYRPPA